MAAAQVAAGPEPDVAATAAMAALAAPVALAAEASSAGTVAVAATSVATASRRAAAAARPVQEAVPTVRSAAVRAATARAATPRTAAASRAVSPQPGRGVASTSRARSVPRISGSTTARSFRTEVSGKELDRAISAQLRGLPEKLAARIARHLVAADMFIDSDPELAYQHAKAAKSRTQRIAVIREALGEAAYAAGHYSEALAELRAAKRMNGAGAYLPIMADCHRALGQPEQAIKLAHSPSVANFEAPAKAEMTIVEAGARRDMGQLDAALRILEQAPLRQKSRESWVVRLRYAYADTLQEAGPYKDALTWFHRTYAIDSDEITDAAVRAEALEKTVERD